MGRRQRGEDNIDIQRRGEKKRRAAFKRMQQTLTRQLRAKVSDDAATIETISAQITKLETFRTLTPEQKTLKSTLIEKLEALRELDKMQKEFEKERADRHARGEFSDKDNNNDDDDDEYSSDDDDDDGDDDAHNGPARPPAPSSADTIKVAVDMDKSSSEDADWAQLLAEDAERADNEEKRRREADRAAAFMRNNASGGGGAASNKQVNYGMHLLDPSAVRQQQGGATGVVSGSNAPSSGLGFAVPISVLVKQKQDQQQQGGETSSHSVHHASSYQQQNQQKTMSGGADEDEDVANFLASLDED